ncbi:type VI secretion system baseplate subunit TssF [Geomonas sp. Red32]|uniref:type VI secretion system baseplate subunit TssF n=1 Tax=Geomonas sp. Red32 TaxID=2912856 RepID=UPI00202CDCA8|nr:type VI secretion system baseplate subunit TssF [Geomonas sp. Red32]MCM0084217.1 type VI secretion system baseplate subunit TssF [Geomonas sp. Red32]
MTGPPAGSTHHPLIEELISRGHEFTFDQVMRVARMRLTAGSAEELPEITCQERVRIRPDLSLSFPAGDVSRVESTGEDGVDLLVTATFLGLYGTSSPLPAHYTEDLLDEAAADSSVTRDLLDLLHERLYHLYFQCWSKYRLFIRIAEEKNPRDLERLFCLIGLGHKELRESLPDAASLLRYAALFNQYPRSATGLEALLRQALGIARIEVEECVLRKAKIPEDQRIRVGLTNAALGVNTVLGSEMADGMGKLRIHVGPLSRKDFDSLLPGPPRHRKLASLVRLYLLDPLDYDLKLTMADGEPRSIVLGDPEAPRLGLNSWCGEAPGEVSAVFPMASSATRATSPAPSEDVDAEAASKGPSTLVEHYLEELARLRELAASYANAHPTVASMVLGNPADPSVERLFEGVALLNALLQHKLNDDWPKIIHDLTTAITPGSLRPIPATTIVVFSPKQNCSGPESIPAGTELKSVPVDGTACRFTTRYPVEMHPLTVTSVTFSQPPASSPTITLKMKLAATCLDDWMVKKLRLFLAADYTRASNLYLVLFRYLKRIVLAPLIGGEPATLSPTHLKPGGFDDSERLFPSEGHGDTGKEVMNEFFILPEKFLFADLEGWETWGWRGKGTEFEIRFELKKLPFELHQVSREDFALFGTPAVNVFEHQAEPISVESQHRAYRVLPADTMSAGLEIHSISSVSGISRGTNRKVIFATSHLGHPAPANGATYRITPERGPFHNESHISISSSTTPLEEVSTLLVDLTCTNGKLPEQLQVGDICERTDRSPNSADFSNCKPVTRGGVPARGSNLLWKELAMNGLNLSLLDAKVLRAMLRSLPGCSPPFRRRMDQTDPITAITSVRVTEADRLMGRSMVRGWDITIRLDDASFLSAGDLYLFGALLDRVLNGFASEASFTRTTIEPTRGERYQWPARPGRRPLQ